MDIDKIDYAARLAHEANRAYCQTLGDTSHLPWEDTPEDIKSSARAGVRAVMASPAVTPMELHAKWKTYKVNDGWVYGPTKDPVKKTHPCIVEYALLPEDQRIKDIVFQSVVRAALNTYDK